MYVYENMYMYHSILSTVRSINMSHITIPWRGQRVAEVSRTLFKKHLWLSGHWELIHIPKDVHVYAII